MTHDAEIAVYIKQLEEENLRLKNANKSLRNNNKGLLQGLTKVQKELCRYKKLYGPLDDSKQLIGRVVND